MINEQIDLGRLPKHVAFIMDGNRTWARNKGLEPYEGHKMLTVALDKTIKHAYELGINEITFYAFSTENWKRSKEEVDYLMNLYNEFIQSFSDKYLDIKFRLLGNINRLPNFLQDSIIEAESNNNDGKITFNMALNYGSREEIVTATKKVLHEIEKGNIDTNDINEELFDKYLYTQGDNPPDLMIRTSGQIRLSNYLLWQLAYAELYFTKIYWPDFDEKEFDRAIIEYQKRTRKFGGN